MYNLFSRKLQRFCNKIKAKNLNRGKFLFRIAFVSYASLLGFSILYTDDYFNKTMTKSVHSLSQIYIPKIFRHSIYSLYCKKYEVRMEDLIKPLDEYKNFSQFFTRKIIDRQIAVSKKENLILSPADSRILSISEVDSDKALIVKDIKYSLGSFLFDQNQQLSCEEINKMKKLESNKLYQIIFYLAPGDYHRFHSPSEFCIVSKREIEGGCKSVNLKALLKWKGEVYQKNARKILHGFYQLAHTKYYMGLGLVGALNVSKIHVNSLSKFNYGQELGYFNLGSTIVMLFEAKNVKEWKIKEGDKVKYGQVVCKVQ